MPKPGQDVFEIRLFAEERKAASALATLAATTAPALLMILAILKPHDWLVPLIVPYLTVASRLA